MVFISPPAFHMLQLLKCKERRPRTLCELPTNSERLKLGKGLSSPLIGSDRTYVYVFVFPVKVGLVFFSVKRLFKTKFLSK